MRGGKAAFCTLQEAKSAGQMGMEYIVVYSRLQGLRARTCSTEHCRLISPIDRKRQSMKKYVCSTFMSPFPRIGREADGQLFHGARIRTPQTPYQWNEKRRCAALWYPRSSGGFKKILSVSLEATRYRADSFCRFW
jgi:hypothetical protein